MRQKAFYGGISINDTVQKTIESLRKNNMYGYFVDDENALLNLISELIPKGATVGCGDSITLDESGVFDLMRNGDYCFLDKHQKGLSSAEKRELYLKNFAANTFITGANALTLNGELLNIDGNGSRVAPMLYGPEQVIVVVGINKIVENVEAAAERARQIAAPLDAKRLGKDTPCVILRNEKKCTFRSAEGCSTTENFERFWKKFSVASISREGVWIAAMNKEFAMILC